jgi:hypothetical protein
MSRDAAMRAPRLLIRTKFALTLLVLIPALAAVAVVAGRGLARVDHQAHLLYTDNVQTIQLSTDLGEGLDRTASTMPKAWMGLSAPDLTGSRAAGSGSWRYAAAALSIQPGSPESGFWPTRR